MAKTRRKIYGGLKCIPTNYNDDFATFEMREFLYQKTPKNIKDNNRHVNCMDVLNCNAYIQKAKNLINIMVKYIDEKIPEKIIWDKDYKNLLEKWLGLEQKELVVTTQTDKVILLQKTLTALLHVYSGNKETDCTSFKTFKVQKCLNFSNHLVTFLTSNVGYDEALNKALFEASPPRKYTISILAETNGITPEQLATQTSPKKLATGIQSILMEERYRNAEVTCDDKFNVYIRSVNIIPKEIQFILPDIEIFNLINPDDQQKISESEKLLINHQAKQKKLNELAMEIKQAVGKKQEPASAVPPLPPRPPQPKTDEISGVPPRPPPPPPKTGQISGVPPPPPPPRNGEIPRQQKRLDILNSIDRRDFHVKVSFQRRKKNVGNSNHYKMTFESYSPVITTGDLEFQTFLREILLTSPDGADHTLKLWINCHKELNNLNVLHVKQTTNSNSISSLSTEIVFIEMDIENVMIIDPQNAIELILLKGYDKILNYLNVKDSDSSFQVASSERVKRVIVEDKPKEFDEDDLTEAVDDNDDEYGGGTRKRRPLLKDFKAMRKKSQGTSRAYWSRVHKRTHGKRCIVQRTKMYRSRPSPPYPANECYGMTKRGNDGARYHAEPNVNGKCTWKKI